jgi:hypothetical protein
LSYLLPCLFSFLFSLFSCLSSCLLSLVSGLLCRFSCLLSLVSCLLSLVSCLLSLVSCLLSLVSCLALVLGKESERTTCDEEERKKGTGEGFWLAMTFFFRPRSTLKSLGDQSKDRQMNTDQRQSIMVPFFRLRACIENASRCESQEN